MTVQETGIPKYVAHRSEDGLRYESVLHHLTEVSHMAEEFAMPFGGEEWACAAGLLHDVGKYSREFQDRILRNGMPVDHSTAGAEVMASINPWLPYCIAGHHGGLPDGGVASDYETTLLGRLNKARKHMIPNYKAYASEVDLPAVSQMPFEVDPHRMANKGYKRMMLFSIVFYIRMVYSCLVDADYLCTERFMSNETRQAPNTLHLTELRDLLEQKLDNFYPPVSHINRIRCRVLDECLRMAPGEQGVYSLTVPTGGGKTYALMRFALRHATVPKRSMRRVIVAEPYTSIIEQNAEVYRQVFGDHNVLEHHSNHDLVRKAESDDDYDNTLRLAAENWDMPIIVTTNVQLFESLYANKPSRCRKLHNMAGSVVVLDEAQMIPTKFLEPCVRVLCELVNHYGCTVVLCSATQPALDPFFAEFGLEVHEIVSDPITLVDELKRTRFTNLGSLSDDELVERLLEEQQALCIVNNRRQAQKLYERCAELANDDGESVFHLSTLMYPSHRSAAIKRVRCRLRHDDPCIVVSTSLVEAGVDLDFRNVYRALAGVDSLVQAAGRCNREMRFLPNESNVFVFESEPCYKPPADLETRAAESRVLLKGELSEQQHPALDSLGVIESYYRNLYRHVSTDDREVVEMLSDIKFSRGLPSIPFAEVASKFNLIEDGSYTVIVPTEQNKGDVTALKRRMATRATMRRLGRYGIGVYKEDLKTLLQVGAVEPVGDDTFLLVDAERYHDDTGLDLYVEGGKAVFL